LETRRAQGNCQHPRRLWVRSYSRPAFIVGERATGPASAARGVFAGSTRRAARGRHGQRAERGPRTASRVGISNRCCSEVGGVVLAIYAVLTPCHIRPETSVLLEISCYPGDRNGAPFDAERVARRLKRLDQERALLQRDIRTCSRPGRGRLLCYSWIGFLHKLQYKNGL